MHAIYHNPRCSKSRQALALLRENGVTPEVVTYLDTPLSYDAIKALYQRLQLPNALAMVRTKEPAFKDAGLNTESDDDTVFRAIAAYPILLERPIVVTEKGARICRPPEAVTALL